MNNNYTNDLLSYLDECEKEENKETIDNGIHTKEEANYFIKKVKECQEQLEEIENTANSEIEKNTKRINEWKDSSSSQIQYNLNKYTSMLRDFWINYGNDKTIKLSNGSITMRKMRDKMELDDDKIYSYLKSIGIENNYSKKVFDKSAFKENLEIDENDSFSVVVDGIRYTIPEGANVIHQERKFEVK